MKQKLWLNNVLFAGIALTLMIFSVMLWLSYREKKEENTNTFLIAQSQENLYQATILLAQVTDNATGSRGFLLTGNKAFLEPLISSRANIYNQITVLRGLNKGNSNRQKLIDSLLYYSEKRMDFSDSTIKLREEKGLEVATALVATERGKMYLDYLGKKINQLTDDENTLLAERLKQNAREAEQQQVKFLSVAFVVVVLLMLLIWNEKKKIEERAQKKSRDEVELLSLQIDNSNDAIYTLDANRKVKSWNTGAEKLYGFTKEEALGMESNALLNTVITNDDILKTLIELDETLYWTGELESKQKNGKTVYVTASTTCVKNNEGKITGYVSVSRDITAQRKLNEELNHLADIVEQSSEGIFSRGTDQRIISWNNGAEQLFGFHKGEVIGKTVSDIGILKLSAEEIKLTEQDIIETGSWRSERSFSNKNGSVFFGAVTANGIQNQKGEIVYVNFIVKDISKRKELEDRLIRINEELEEKVEERTKTVIEKERNYRYLFENSPLPMWVIDVESYQFLDVNETALQHYGYSREQFLSMTAVDIRPAEDREAFKQIYEYGEILKSAKSQDIWKHLKKDGSLIAVEIHSHPIVFENHRAALVLVNDITKKNKAEEKLKASEEQFRYSLDNMLEGLQIVGFDWKYIYVNKALCLQGKYSKDELIGFTMMEKYPGIENTALFASCQRCIAERISLHLENEFEFPDKSKGWFELSIQPVPEGVFILSVDITDRKKAEENLKHNEKRFRSLIENISDAIVLNDRDSTILYQSPSVTKILGYSLEERQHTKVIDYVHPDDLDEFKEVYQKLDVFPNTPVPFQYRVRHKNGAYIWLEGVVTNLTGEPEVNGYIANYRDVTKRKELEERLNKAYTMARIGVWEIDLKNETIFWSDLTREIHETPPDFIPRLETGINFYKEGPGRDLIKRKVKEAIEEGKPWDVELQILTAKNNERWIRSIGETEFSEGKCIRVYGSFQDIDDRKRIEETIRQLNMELEEKILIRTAQLRKSNEELEAFSYSVSHDLRAPLRAIIGYSSILQEDYTSKLDEEAQRITGIIKSNTQRMGLLIDDLLAFSRLGKQELMKVTVNSLKLVNEVVKTVMDNESNDKSISWVISDLPVVEADISSLRQVWVNLISNALKYSGNTPAPVIEIGSYEENKKTVFYVKDNGVGFNEKYKNKLFKVFQRLHSVEEFEGTGIGLAIVNKIVTKHGGDVWADGAVNKGATFFFSLPLSTD